MVRTALLFCAVALALPASAKDSLGVYSSWAAFRDPETPRCYAIAKPRGDRPDTYASVATWPRQSVRNQMHFRLSRPVGGEGLVQLRVGSTNFALTARGRDAWARDATMDAAIVAALRSSDTMRATGRDGSGRRFTDRYDLAGIATAMDAAVLGCADLR